MTIEATLKERGDRYGSFEHHAEIAQGLQDLIRAQEGWQRLAPDQKQALTVIMDKIARMLNGDPAYRDNWHDIVGYAKLVDDRMAKIEMVEVQISATILGDWQPWRGGDKPPCPNDSLINVKFSDGSVASGPPHDFVWHRDTGTCGYVTAWRYA